MIEPKFVEWMNMELDGVLPPRRSKELHEYLSSHPDAAKYFDGLRATVAAVDSVEPAEPPPGLERRITDAVPWDRHPVADRGGGPVAALGKWFTGPRWRYAAVFGFGIVFGLLVYSAINYDNARRGAGLDITDFSGTMRHITTADGFRQTQEFGVDLDEVHGSVSLHQSNEVLLTEVALDTPGRIEWVVEYDADDVSFDGYRCFDGDTGDVIAARTEMRVVQSGDTRYLLFFTQKDHPVTPIVVKIYSADQLLLEKSLTPAAKSAD
jgi:hypothetical protein